MQERVKTSFIPKASLKVERKRKPTGSPVAFLNIIAMIIFVAALVVAVGLFLFEQLTVQNIARKTASLERARAAFEPATIKELSRLNTRLDVGQDLLNSHVALSRLFDEIEERTLDNVRFGSFSFDETSPGRVVVTMAGETRSFNALALQADTFGDSPFFSSPIFSDFNIDQTGTVVFNFSAAVNMGELAYQAGGPSAEPQPQENVEPENTEESAATTIEEVTP